MKRAIILLIFSAFVTSVYATSIAWGVLDTNGSEVYGDSNKLDVMFDINIQKFGDQTYLYPSENKLRYHSLAPIDYWNSGAWLEAYVGELVDASTIFGRRDYWFYEMANAQPEYSSGQIGEIEFNKSYYLMFAIEDMDDAWAYRLKETTDPPKLYYGWAEYVVDETDTFKILNSAIDFDGGAMIVGAGAVPEPASELFLLLGVVALILRRKTSLV